MPARQGPFGRLALRTEGVPVGTLPGQDVEAFNSIAPRIGVNLDVMGDGRIALKGSWGRYHWNVNDDFSGVNPGAARTQTFEWNDLNGDTFWDCDPLHVDVSNGCITNELGLRLAGSPGSLTATGTTIDPNITLPYTDEIAASVEFQVMDDTALRFGFVRKSVRDAYDRVNPDRS